MQSTTKPDRTLSGRAGHFAIEHYSSFANTVARSRPTTQINITADCGRPGRRVCLLCYCDDVRNAHRSDDGTAASRSGRVIVDTGPSSVSRFCERLARKQRIYCGAEAGRATERRRRRRHGDATQCCHVDEGTGDFAPAGTRCRFFKPYRSGSQCDPHQ